MSCDGFDPYASDARQLTPQQWMALRKSIIKRARKERDQVIHQMVEFVRRSIRERRRIALSAIHVLRKAWSRQRGREVCRK